MITQIENKNIKSYYASLISFIIGLISLLIISIIKASLYLEEVPYYIYYSIMGIPSSFFSISWMLSLIYFLKTKGIPSTQRKIAFIIFLILSITFIAGFIFILVITAIVGFGLSHM